MSDLTELKKLSADKKGRGWYAEAAQIDEQIMVLELKARIEELEEQMAEVLPCVQLMFGGAAADEFKKCWPLTQPQEDET